MLKKKVQTDFNDVFNIKTIHMYYDLLGENFDTIGMFLLRH